MTIDYSNISAIILSGGKSSRMGTDKCELKYKGKTLLNIQIEKMLNLGIDDVIASGYKGNNCETKVILDDISKGPLSGILVGLNAIKNDVAIVLSVDVPLISKQTIEKLVAAYLKDNTDIVILRHNKKLEPLIGLYNKNIKEKIEDILNGDNYSVMCLIEKCKSKIIDVDDSDEYYLNINYKKDYDDLLRYENKL